VRSIFVLPTLLALLACQQKPTDPPDAGEPTTNEPTAVESGTVEPATDKPTDADGKVVVLSPLEKEVSVAVGTTLQYSFKSHASVGFGANQTSSDEAVVRYVRTDTAYKQSEAERAGKPGSDAATGTFVFQAVAPGTATLTVDEVFRGTVEQSTTFTIVVTE
jgi:hypothetical protein